MTIVNNESGFNPKAQNGVSTAHGLFQFLDTTWASYGCQKTDNFRIQIQCGLKYVGSRYRLPSEALKHWLAVVPVNGKKVGNWY